MSDPICCRISRSAAVHIFYSTRYLKPLCPRHVTVTIAPPFSRFFSDVHSRKILPYSQIAASRIPVLSAKVNKGSSMKYWEIIADNLSKADWSYGCVSAADSDGRTGVHWHAQRNTDGVSWNWNLRFALAAE
jgi:hypothetical protein